MEERLKKIYLIRHQNLLDTRDYTGDMNATLYERIKLVIDKMSCIVPDNKLL